MENASKALIIAGAILLSIIIISLGIIVVNNTRGTINNANLNSEEIQTFNGRFEAYCGTAKSNAEMNALVQAIAASNGAQNGKSDQHYIGITVSDTIATTYYTGGSVTAAQATAGSVTYPSFSAGITYKATPTTGADGYINAVSIEKN